MEVKGICFICGKVGKLYTCVMCGALVCSNCYVFDKKICKICAAKF